MPIRLIPLHSRLPLSEVASAVENISLHAVVADTYVEGAESWNSEPWGWSTTRGKLRVENVDHHAPVASMRREVSSGNLAISYVNSRGSVTNGLVLINHCDCDSIVSSAILAGVVAPCAELGEAVLAADHSGVANDIADALQPLESLRDLPLSLATLRQLLDGGEVAAEVARLRDARRRDRELWRNRLERGEAVRWHGRVALIVEERRIPTELLVGLLPDAEIIITAAPRESRWNMKIRLGRGASGRFNLQDLAIREFDPGFGGRWNAGSNTRAAGTDLDPGDYANRVEQLIAAVR